MSSYNQAVSLTNIILNSRLTKIVYRNIIKLTLHTFSHTLYHDYVTLEAKSIVIRYIIVGY
jgi:hypothetical protein